MEGDEEVGHEVDAEGDTGGDCEDVPGYEVHLAEHHPEVKLVVPSA